MGEISRFRPPLPRVERSYNFRRISVLAKTFTMLHHGIEPSQR